MIDRRDFANSLALGLLGAQGMAPAQTAQLIPVVGVLHSGAVRGRNIAALVKGLSENGYVEGKNLSLEIRFGGSKQAAFPGFAAELVALKVDVIYAVGPAAVKAARDATRVIPIVAFDLETDPVQAGWASSLARPGGNVTGLFLDIPALAGKWIELLRAAVPKVRRLGLLWDSTTGTAQLLAAQVAAQGFGIETQVTEVRGSDGLEAALAAGIGAGIKGIVVLGSPGLSTAAPIKRIVGFAAQHRLPSIAPLRWYADAGGLLSYGVNLEDFYARTGGFVARLLKGAKPGDLAIELPTKFELAVNLKTARALGIAIPQALLLRADEVIE